MNKVSSILVIPVCAKTEIAFGSDAVILHFIKIEEHSCLLSDLIEVGAVAQKHRFRLSNFMPFDPFLKSILLPG